MSKPKEVATGEAAGDHARESEPRYVHLANKLEIRLRAGEWDDGKVPTVREIAAEYGVSSFTASRALHMLQDRGLVVNRDRSGCYVVSGGSPETKITHWGMVLRVSPGPWREASEAAVRVGFEKMGGGNSFTTFAPDLGGRNGPAAFVREILEIGVEGLFFMPSRVSDVTLKEDEGFLAACRSAGIAVVLIDRNLRGSRRPLDYDLIASDHFDGGVQCTVHLINTGRKAIGCVVASPTSSHQDRLAGYLFALETIDGSRPRVLKVPEELDERAIYPWLATAVQESGIDALICYQDYTAVGLTLELLRRGVNVPRDVAIVGCDDLPIGHSFSLGITTYTYPSRELATAAVRVMHNRIAHPNDPPMKVQLRGGLLVRESSAQCDRGQSPGDTLRHDNAGRVE